MLQLVYYLEDYARISAQPVQLVDQEFAELTLSSIGNNPVTFSAIFNRYRSTDPLPA